jgi:hypothetical protein
MLTKKNDKMINIFDIDVYDDVDDDVEYEPDMTEDFKPTDAPAGTLTKMEVLSRRFFDGNPLWHPEDRTGYEGLSGVRLVEDMHSLTPNGDMQ